MPKHGALPANLPPRGLARDAAAEYVGVCASTLDKMVSDGRMPKPRKINSRNVWDVRALDAAFDRLPVDGEENRTENAWDNI